MTPLRLGAAVLAACAFLTISAWALAQDAARIAAGEAAWDKAGCLQCHGASGEGGVGGEFPAGPSLKATLLDRATLVDTISCGRPGTEMPAWLKGAYTEVSCYGIPKGPPPTGLQRTPVLGGDEIEALIDYLMAEVVGK
jgi:mono/diheme cytochrome c family protein